MTSSLFSATPIELEATGSMPARLLPLDQRSCASLASGIVAMEPWSVMNYPADKLAAFLASPDAGAARYVVSVKGKQSGVVSVRHPWLKGPYLELLALLPEAQNQGIGSSIMAWFESAGLKHGARNLWVCAPRSTHAPCDFTSAMALRARQRCRASSPTAMTKFCCANFR
jgi:GNAT superfamily N-acetyltransferase